MKRRSLALRPAQRLLLCYALAAALWVLRCLVGGGVMLNYKLSGRMPERTLTLQDLQTESLVPWQDGLISSDPDPHLIWQEPGYIETLRLRADYSLPPGSVAVYWLRPGQTDYRETQKKYAYVTAEGEYTFDLGGVYVSALRVDPDSRGGVGMHIHALELNPATPWYRRLLPSAGVWLLLLFAPVPAAALWQALAQALPRKKTE